MSIFINGLDLETTGLSADAGHRIIEIAISTYKTDDFATFSKVGKTYLKRVDPKRSIDAKAQAVHGISIDQLLGCPTWEELAPEIHKRLFDCSMIVAHNINFDIPFIVTEFDRVGLSPKNVELFCTLENGRNATAMGKVPNLGELCWATGVDYDADSAHAADYDIDCTMEAFFKGVKLGLFTLPVALTTLLEKAA